MDGKRLRKAVNAGWLWLSRHREHLNAINVFPVADGDTGTNMVQTLRSAATGANEAKSDSLEDVAGAIAIYSLRGAQGNSGVILSQYFKGVAEFIGSKKKLYIEDVAGTFMAGANCAYQAVREPKEGTILTVLREVAEHAESVKGYRKSLSHLMETAIEHGRKTLSSTRFKLKVLCDAGVVDAGGQGFIHFLEGIYNLMKRGEVAREGIIAAEEESLPVVVEEHSNYRFCSEFLVRGQTFDINAIRNRLETAGDSLIVACTAFGTESYLRIHIHTDDPAPVEKLASSVGTLEKRKVDDMKAQNTTMRKWRARFKRTSQKTIRIVTDSTCDLPAELAAFYDIEVVPLKVSFGEDTYLDGVDLDNQAFYRKLKESTQLPRTSQPSPGDLLTRYHEMFDRGDCQQILSIHVSSKLSGTYNSAVTAAREFGRDVIVFDSSSVSLGMGLLAIAASEMARNGDSINKITERLEALKKEQGLFFTLGSLDYLIKGGRVGKARGFVGKLLGLRPILTLRDGEIHPVAKVRGEENIIDKIISLLPPDGHGIRWAVAHAECPAQGAAMSKILRERYNSDEILAGEIGPTVGTHAGPGTWGVFYMKG